MSAFIAEQTRQRIYEKEIEKNEKEFKSVKNIIQEEYAGQYVVFKDGNVIASAETDDDAMQHVKIHPDAYVELLRF